MVGKLLQQMIDEIQARALLVVRMHDPPPSLGNVRPLEHDLLRLGVGLPAAARFQIHRAQFPLLQWIVDAAEKTQVLLLVGDREPIFQQLDARANQHALELRHGAEELLVFLGAAKSHHMLHAGAVVPTAIEQNDFPGRRQVRHIALEVPLCPLAVIRRRQRHYAADAWIELLGDALDRAALAGRIAPFEQDQNLFAALRPPNPAASRARPEGDTAE